VIGLAGDLSRPEAIKLATGLLPPALPAPPADLLPGFPALVPAPPEGTERLPKLTQVYLGLQRDSLPVTDRDFPALLLANHVLGGHFYSRLYVALRHEGGETYSPFVISPEDPEASAYILFTYTRTANAAATEAKLRLVLARLHDGGISEDERRAAAGYLLGHRLFARTSPGEVLDRYLWERERGLPLGFRDQLAERAAALPLSEINAVIRRFYDPSRFTLLRVVPK
jgi:zinc protease